MTPDEVNRLMPTRWDAVNRAVNNKKALDLAFLKHQWTMQQDAANNAAQQDNTRLQGGFRIDEQKLQNQGSNTPEKVASEAVIKWAAARRIDIGTPEGQKKAQSAYQFFFNQLTGNSPQTSNEPNTLSGVMTGLRAGIPESAGNMATGGMPPPQPSLPSEPVSSVRPAAPAAPTAQPGTVPTAVNPKTGKRLYYRNGKWVNK